MSVNGSPIAGSAEDIVISVPLGNGEVRVFVYSMLCIYVTQGEHLLFVITVHSAAGQ